MRCLCVQMSLMKNSVLRGGTDLHVDERTFLQYEVLFAVSYCDVIWMNGH